MKKIIKFFEDEGEWEGLIPFIKHTYWKLVPYDWRPFTISYRLKCFFFKRYTTVKPRTLKYHTWCDRCTLLPHMMFEILTQFIEEECSPEIIDWEASDHRVIVNGESVNVRDEMQALYDWWHKEYLKEYPKREEELWAEIKKYEPTFLFEKMEIEDTCFYSYNPNFSSKEDKTHYKSLMGQISSLEREKEKELIKMCHRLVEVIPYLWT